MTPGTTPTPPRVDSRRRRSQVILQGARLRNRLLASVLILLLLYTFAIAKTLIVPILLAVLLSLMLSPAVRWLCRWHLPRALASLLVLLTFLSVLVVALGALAGPMQTFFAKAPQGLQRIEQSVSQWRKPIDDASRQAGQSLAQMGDSPSASTAIVQAPGFMSRLVAIMPLLLAGVAVVVFLTFLLLLYGDAILRKLVTLLPDYRSRRRLIESTRHTQHQLSSYVLAISAINVGLGLFMAAVLYLLGVEDPLLWGGLVAVLNFAPYVGPLVGAVLLTLAGFAQFADPGHALMLPLAFLLIQSLEGQLLTPMILGRHMSLDPVMVFLSLLLLGWLWGVVGVLIAVPLLTCLRICAEQVRGWYPLARLLGPAPVPVRHSAPRNRRVPARIRQPPASEPRSWRKGGGYRPVPVAGVPDTGPVPPVGG